MVVYSDEPRATGPPDDIASDRRHRLRTRFQVVRKLGQGTYGKVQLAINKETRQEVAIKTIRKAKIENGQDLLRIRREIQIMSSIHHPHIIHIYEVFENSEKIVLVMQYASGGELYDYLGCHKKLPEKEARRIFRQIAAAIYYCHKNKICHRDLKLENIILDDKGNAKIADFGLSNVFDERRKLHTFCGSPLYASPEIVKGMPYCGPEVDCWSLGVLLYTMVYGAMPFDGSNFKRLVKQISEGDYYEPKLKSKASGIIRRLLTVDVSKRATIKDACTDDWVNEGYDHSLLQVAYDMSCLSPVLLNHQLALSTLSSNREPLPDTTYQKSVDSIKYEKSLSTAESSFNGRYYSPKQISRLSCYTGAKNSLASCQSSAIPSTEQPKTISSEVSKVLEDVMSRVENRLEPGKQDKNDPQVCEDSMNRTLHQLYKTRCGLSSENSFRIKLLDRIASKDTKTQNGRLLTEEFDFQADSSPGTDISVAKQRQSSMRNEALSIHDKGYIPPNDKILNSNRESTVEKFRAWRASIEKPKQNSERILPIFDVTSVIPKRKNEDDAIDKTVISAIENRLMSNHIKLNSHFEGKIKEEADASAVNEQYSHRPRLGKEASETVDTIEKKAENSAHSKDRNDVFYILNQICHQRMVSSEKKRLISESTAQAKCDSKELKKEGMRSSEDAENSNISVKPYQMAVEEVDDRNESKPEPAINSENENLSEVTHSVEETSSVSTDAPNCCETSEEKNYLAHSSITTQSQSTTNKVIRDESDAPVYKDGENEVKRRKSSTSYSVPQTNDFEENSKPVAQELNPTVLEGHYDSSVARNCKGEKSANNRSENRKLISNAETAIDGLEQCGVRQCRRMSRPQTKSKMRSLSVDDDERMGDLEKILRRPRKYSLCALLAATFEFEGVRLQGRRQSENSRRPPGKVEIPKSFDPSSESESGTPIEKRELVLFPTITVAEGKQKIEKKIEKVKNSALSMKIRRKSEASTRRKLKKYTRSCTDVMQSIGNSEMYNDTSGNLQKSLPNFSDAQSGSLDNPYISSETLTKFATEMDENSRHNGSGRTDISEAVAEMHVPISRCYRKMTFLSGEEKWYEQDEAVAQESIHRGGASSRMESGMFTNDSFQSGIVTPNTKALMKMRKKSEKSHRKERKDEPSSQRSSDEGISSTCEERDQGILESNESLNTSSFDKDSSDDDNDDDDDDLDAIFGSQLEVCESGDLWKLLKSINDGLSHRIKKSRSNHSKPIFSRSKSQDCKSGRNRQLSDKLLTRSLSKEEKPRLTADNSTSELIEPVGDSACSLMSSSSKGHRNPSDGDGSAFDSENPSTSASSSGFFENSRNVYQKSMKAKYYSLSNLLDSESVLFENSLKNSFKNENHESSENLSLQDGLNIFCKTDDESALAKKLSLYGTLRPRKGSKYLGSKSSLCFDEKNAHLLKTYEARSFSDNDKKLSSALRSKAISDLDISYRGITSSSESMSVLSSKDTTAQSSLRFAKSLGSKLDLEPRSILIDSSSKASASKSRDERMPKKHTRRVSFTPDSTKQRNNALALDAVAKAHKALSESERTVGDSTNDESGTLLEALKTHGYKFLISQRLQESQQSEGDIKSKRHSMSFLRNLNSYNFNDMSGISSNDRLPMDSPEYLKIMYLRRLLNSISNPYSESEDIGFSNQSLFNGPVESNMHGTTSTNWCKMPNMWLHQNVEDMRYPKAFFGRPMQNFAGGSYDQNSVETMYDYLNLDDDVEIDDVNIRLPNQLQQKHQTTKVLKNPGVSADKPSETSLEKLSMRIKALKNRCHQRSSDEQNSKLSSVDALHSGSKNVTLRKKPEDSYKEMNGEFTFASDVGLAENKEDDSGESVSDRIWRKSFYSRFNDTSTLRRRRSMLMDTDYLSEPSFLKSAKIRPSAEKPIEDCVKMDDKFKRKLKKMASQATAPTSEPQTVESSGSNVAKSTEQNIPNHVECSDALESSRENVQQKPDE